METATGLSNEGTSKHKRITVDVLFFARLCCVYFFLKKRRCEHGHLLCIEMRLLVRSELVFVEVSTGLTCERHGVVRVAFFCSMGGSGHYVRATWVRPYSSLHVFTMVF